jgi:predicted GTPase
MADVVVINKVDTAGLEQIERARDVVMQLRPGATVIEAASPVSVADGAQIRGRRVLVVEDGPTVTHGGMPFGAGWIAARRYAASEIVDPRPYAVGSLRDTFAAYPHLGPVLPAMGYGPVQVDELARTIDRTPADLVLVATPVDLGRLLHPAKPVLRVRYELQEIGEPTLGQVLTRLFPAAEQPARSADVAASSVG